MANPIKYTTGAIGTPAPYLKKDNFWIGLDPIYYYGPSGTTNFWNGYGVTQTGYAIYLNKASNGPSIYAPISDSDLVTTAKRLGASSSITTASQALSYFYELSTMICLDRNYPSIVWSDLKSFYDFGFSPCYPRGGVKATDLSPYLVTGKATVSDSIYNSALNGYLDFPGSNSYVKFDSSITLGSGTDWTISVVMKATSFDTGFGTLVSNDGSGAINASFGTYNGYISYDVYKSGWTRYTGTTPLSTGEWYYLTWVHTSAGNLKMYVNNWVDFDGAVNQPSNGGPLNVLGATFNSNFTGSISKFMYYDKPLTYDQITQNINLGLSPLKYESAGKFSGLIGGYPAFSYNAANETSGNISISTLRNLTSDGGSGSTADFTIDPLNISGTIAEISSDWGGVLAIESGYTYISSIYLTDPTAISFWMRYNGDPNVAAFVTYHTFLKAEILSGGNLKFTVSSALSARNCTGTVNVCDGKWHHVCLIHTVVGFDDIPTPGIYIFVDGVQDASNTNTISYFNSTNFNLYIGGNSGSTHSCYFGPINVYTNDSVNSSDIQPGVWRDYYYHVNRFQPGVKKYFQKIFFFSKKVCNLAKQNSRKIYNIQKTKK